MIAIVASMEREVSFLMGRAWLNGSDTGEARTGEVRALVCVTGVGAKKASAGTADMLDGSARPDCVLSLGFATALVEGLDTGDLVLCPRLFATGWDGVVASDSYLLRQAQEGLRGPGAPRHFVADSLTVDRMVSEAGEKKRLAEATSAWVANMEDFWVGAEVARHRIPFLSVRAVLDTARQGLPPYLAGIGDKRPLMQALHVAANGLVRPWSIPGVVRLSGQAKLARASLAAFCTAFLRVRKTAGSRSGDG